MTQDDENKIESVISSINSMCKEVDEISDNIVILRDGDVHQCGYLGKAIVSLKESTANLYEAVKISKKMRQ